MKRHQYFFILGLIFLVQKAYVQDTDSSFSSVLKEILPQDYMSTEDDKNSSVFETSQNVSTHQILLKCLDKITAHVQDIKAKIGEKVTFGTLEITARFCRQSAPEESPDSIAYLEIVEKKYQQSDHPIFKGWMFASSPAISAMEHPVYDIWVQNCDNKS